MQAFLHSSSGLAWQYGASSCSADEQRLHAPKEASCRTTRVRGRAADTAVAVTAMARRSLGYGMVLVRGVRGSVVG